MKQNKAKKSYKYYTFTCFYYTLRTPKYIFIKYDGLCLVKYRDQFICKQFALVH